MAYGENVPNRERMLKGVIYRCTDDGIKGEGLCDMCLKRVSQTITEIKS